MLQREQKLDIRPRLNWEMFAPRERIVFLDIETTGFKASVSSLYLIGIADYTDGDWMLHQYFAESKADEMQLIHALSRFLREKKGKQDHLILVTYNGDAFDLPFLKDVERGYGESGTLKDIVSFDLYKAVKPYKKMAGLADLKLKTVEKKCGICRKDPYSGGDLIAVYEEYLRLCRIPKGGCEDNELNSALMEKCLGCLLLHNEEDIADMIPSMQILGYRYLMDGLFDFEQVSVETSGDKQVLDIRFRLRERLPEELYHEDGGMVVSVSGEDPYLLEITAAMENGELRFYYPDYKDYYYLPAEDMAVHKSVGEFVDRKNRVRATASNCYARQKGTFFPLPAGAGRFSPFFYKSYKGRAYACFREELLEEASKWKEYALAVLTELL